MRLLVIATLLIAPGAASAAPGAAPAAAKPAAAKAASAAKPKATNAKATKPTAATPGPGFNQAGNLLIADQLNNRVIEIDGAGKIVWQYGDGPQDLSGMSPLGPRSVERVGDLTLIAAAGILPGYLPACPDGCLDNRVLLVDPKGAVVWQYGRVGPGGSGPGQLELPMRARLGKNGNVFIADQGNHRVIEVSRKDKTIVWQHGKTGVAGKGDGELDAPSDVAVTIDGNILIADTRNHRVLVVDRDHKVVSTYTAGGTLQEVTAASVVAETGNLLVADHQHRRVCELDANDRSIWSHWPYTLPGSTVDPQVSCAYRLPSGDTIICDQWDHRILRLDPLLNQVASYGNLGQPGFGKKNASEGLNAPYDADVIGD